LLRSPIADQIAEGRQEIAQSKALMRETGAMLFKNFIDEIDVEHGDAREIPIIPSRENRMA
jgi:hypothetical protein